MSSLGFIRIVLDSKTSQLSDQNYDQKFTFYRFWFDLAQVHSEISPDQVFDAIWGFRKTAIGHGSGKFIHPTAPLALRFASDAESDGILASHNVVLSGRLCARFLREFFEGNVRIVQHEDSGCWEYCWETLSGPNHDGVVWLTMKRGERKPFTSRCSTN